MIEIPFEGTLTKNEFLSVSKLVRRPVTKNRIVFDVWVALVIVGVVLMAFGIWDTATVGRRASAQPNSVSWLVLFVVGAMALMIGIKVQRMPEKQWNQNEMYRVRRHGKITDRGIEIHTPLGQTKFLWANITGYGEHRGILVLFQGTAIAVPFPQRFFASEEDWSLFRSVVTGKLKITHQVTEASISISQIPIYVLILVVVIALLIRTCKR